MDVIICGSRSICDMKIVERAVIDSEFTITRLISGNARGVDRTAEEWAKKNNVPVKRFYPEWRKYGNRAGMIRNEEMLDHIIENDGAVICVWDGESRGTKHMIDSCLNLWIPHYIYAKA